MSNIASRVIDKCGGPAAVAKMLRVHVSRCHRWTYPTNKNGGTGGVIPTRHQQTLIVEARKRGIDLSPADFFDIPDALREAS